MLWLVYAVMVFDVAKPIEANLGLQKFNRKPVRFNQSVLAESEQVEEGRQFIEHLGFVRKLNTMLSPKSAKDMQTKFAIINNRRVMLGIKFLTETYCMLDGKFACEGPYEFNLDYMIQSEFNINSRTIIIIPGYYSGEEASWVRRTREQWLRLDPEADVIQVSWTDSNRGIYAQTVAQTPLLARQITIFLHYLATLSNTTLADEEFLSRVHIIGHSLGAHTAGFVGQDVGGKLGRITGLDPAGPSFDQFDLGEKLDPSDARFVEVIHTNRGTISYLNAAMTVPLYYLARIPGINSLGNTIGSEYNGEADTAWYGIDQQVGHIDYYANNGRVQPGCSGLMHICDHNRAHDIYLELLRYTNDLNAELSKHFNDSEPWLREKLVKSGRFVAFEAENYESFISGKTFSKYRKDLMTFVSDKVQVDEDARVRAFNSCSIPLDLTTPVDELRRELQLYRGLRLGEKRPGAKRYFFQTLDQPRYVGDHFLLKLNIDHERSKWVDESCSLMAQIEAHTEDGLKDIVLETGNLTELIDSNQNIGMPFIHAYGPAGRAHSLKFFTEVKHNTNKQETTWYLSKYSEKILRSLLPLKITLSISKPRTPSFLKTIGYSIMKAIKSDFSSTKDCSLPIRGVELQLLGEAGSGNFGKVAGIYGPENSLGRERLEVDTLETYKKKMSRQSFSNPWIIGWLLGGSQNDLSLTLKSLVVYSD